MKYNFRLIFLFLIFSISNYSIGQILPVEESDVIEELNRRGLNEEEVRSALEKNGFDLDSIQNASPEEILIIQSIIEDLQASKQSLTNESSDDIVKDLPKNIFIEKEENEKNPVQPILTQADSLPPIFGHEYINVTVTKPIESVQVHESYILGTGDIISVSIWSKNAQFEKSFIVNQNGYIRLGEAKQRIFVRGMKLNAAREKIRSRFRQYYRFNRGEFSLSLESSRSINISIFGEILQAGAYSFTATHNVLDALRLTGGIREKGSIRSIKLIKANGDLKIFDLYAYLRMPDQAENLFMDDGDIIHVPFAASTVEIRGAVKRPGRFEMLDQEGIMDLIEFAGGFSEDANSGLIQIERFENNKKTVFDLDYLMQEKNGSNFTLQNGDILFVRSIMEEAKNFVVVEGEVVNTGRFERFENMRIKDLLDLAIIKEESKTDFAFMKRRKKDGTSTYLRLNLDEIIYNDQHKNNLFLNDRDTLTIWAKRRFVDDGTFSVEGSIRFPGTYSYDFTQKIYFSDALILAGGVSRDASKIAFIHRSDPLKPNEKQYIRINLDRQDTSLVYHENIVLEPFDRIEILSKNLFTEKSTVKISGPVNNPGEFQYGKNMNLKDLLILAGGFKRAASTQNIEISRVLLKENKPTEITIAKVNFERELENIDASETGFELEPYDHVKVRYVPEFEFQRDVEILGEVKYPGLYTLATKNEKISDLIQKAGGFSEEAFLDGATLFRMEDSLGFIVVNMKDAMSIYDSKYNYILKHGDIIDIPKMKDFVTIKGATKANEIYSEKLLQNPRGINVPYHKSKDAGYYIKKYTGGFAENASRKEVFVEHPNGEIQKSSRILFFTNYPGVRKGSVINVGEKAKKENGDKKDQKDVDWSKVISDSLAQAMTIFTLILLAKQASN